MARERERESVGRSLAALQQPPVPAAAAAAGRVKFYQYRKLYTLSWGLVGWLVRIGFECLGKQSKTRTALAKVTGKSCRFGVERSRLPDWPLRAFTISLRRGHFATSPLSNQGEWPGEWARWYRKTERVLLARNGRPCRTIYGLFALRKTVFLGEERECP